MRAQTPLPPSGETACGIQTTWGGYVVSPGFCIRRVADKVMSRQRGIGGNCRRSNSRPSALESSLARTLRQSIIFASNAAAILFSGSLAASSRRFGVLQQRC